MTPRSKILEFYSTIPYLMTDEELAAAGANKSMTHVDFMFGSRQMHIEGICQDGSTVTVFDHGNFVF